MTIPIFIRPAVQDDLGLIFTSWLGSHKKSIPWLEEDNYKRLYRYAVEKALQQCPALVACHPEHIEHIFGWVCADAIFLHYIFVKVKFRCLGIGKQLLKAVRKDEMGFISTVWTLDEGYLRKANLTIDYRPDLFLTRKLKGARYENYQSPAQAASSHF